MGWKWMAAAAMALGVTMGGAAEARTYLLNITLNETALDNPRRIEPITPFSFQQTWTVGSSFAGDPPYIEDEAEQYIAQGIATASADLEVSGYTADLAAANGFGALSSRALIEHQIHEAPPFSNNTLWAALISDTWIYTDYGGAVREQSLYFQASMSPIPGTAPMGGHFNPDDFGAWLTGGAGYFLVVLSDSGCPDGSCDASLVRYQGTFTATALGVPEPATWALMILGFGGAGWRLRVSRRAAPAR